MILNYKIGLIILNDPDAFKIEETASVDYTEISKYDNHFVLELFFDYTYSEIRSFIFDLAPIK